MIRLFSSQLHPKHRFARGWTVVELLVSIGVIVILCVLITVPLTRSRASANQAVNLSNLRSHSQTILSYVDDSAGIFPYFTRIGAENTIVQGGGLAFRTSYFGAYETWHVALADVYFSGNAKLKSLYPPNSRAASNSWRTMYHYPCAFIAHPDYWRPQNRTGPSQYTEVGLNYVIFPSDKALVVDSFGVRSKREVFTASMVDGSAAEIPSSKTVNGYQRGDGYIFRSVGAVHLNDSPRLLHTLEGASGRDRRP